MARCTQVFLSPTRRHIAIACGVIAVLGFAYSIWAKFYMPPCYRWLVVIFWSVGPPLYFCLEYFLLFDNWTDSDAVDELKHRQTLFSLFWAGISAYLVFLYTT